MYRSIFILVPPLSYLRSRAFWPSASASLPISPHTLRLTDREPATLPHLSFRQVPSPESTFVEFQPDSYSHYPYALQSLVFSPHPRQANDTQLCNHGLRSNCFTFQPTKTAVARCIITVEYSLGGCSDAGYAPAAMAQVPNQGWESLACRTGKSVADSTRRFRTFLGNQKKYPIPQDLSPVLLYNRGKGKGKRHKAKKYLGLHAVCSMQSAFDQSVGFWYGVLRLVPCTLPYIFHV